MRSRDHSQPTRSDLRQSRLFRSLDSDNDGRVTNRRMRSSLERLGLLADDPRLRETYQGLAASDSFGEEEFETFTKRNVLLVEQALQGNLVVPDFPDFTKALREIFESVTQNRAGSPATYIPQLDFKGEDADRFAVGLCTVDGQRAAFGSSKDFFTVQSTCKPINYALALEQSGAERVHQHVGREPSGLSFNELTLDRDNRPHNPMINAGAIMSCALIADAETEGRGNAGRRFESVLDCWAALSGGQRPVFDNSVYLSERETADRNFALAYYMREKGVFPKSTDLHDVLDFYFQCCAIEVNAETFAVVAATLANGGVCPLTGERAFETATVQRCLSLMSSCGMYDFSGEFAFRVGLPAKSGVSGAVLLVIPHVAGFCIWSPSLDENGNSVRGIDFCERLVDSFGFHGYANLSGSAPLNDPRESAVGRKARQVNELVWAASKGDTGGLHRRQQQGADINCADYDSRTPLHLAAAEGQAEVVEFFVEQSLAGAAELNPKDRWGRTPLDDAELHHRAEVVEILTKADCTRSRRGTTHENEAGHTPLITPSFSENIDELIWAASIGDMAHIRQLVARGTRLDGADYDFRTPLHLAASEGHAKVVRFLLDEGVDPAPRDRWGWTPLDDARRHNKPDVVMLLEAAAAAAGHASTQWDSEIAACVAGLGSVSGWSIHSDVAPLGDDRAAETRVPQADTLLGAFAPAVSIGLKSKV